MFIPSVCQTYIPTYVIRLYTCKHVPVHICTHVRTCIHMCIHVKISAMNSSVDTCWGVYTYLELVLGVGTRCILGSVSSVNTPTGEHMYTCSCTYLDQIWTMNLFSV